VLQKVLVVGESGVGKTTAIRKLIKRPFPTRVVPTVGFEFYSGVVDIDGKEIRLKFWDICRFYFSHSRRQIEI
jgi:small GTP-binding protein